jgi:hypothetical protein
VLRRLSAKKSGCHGGFDIHGGFAECLPAEHSAKSFYFFKKYFAECLPGRALDKENKFFSKKALPSACLGGHLAKK